MMLLPAGVGLTTRWLGWGCGFLMRTTTLAGYLSRERLLALKSKLDRSRLCPAKILYRNRRTDASRMSRIKSERVPALPSRGCAFGDYDNDGDIDVLINPVNAMPELLRAIRQKNNWITISGRREV